MEAEFGVDAESWLALCDRKKRAARSLMTVIALTSKSETDWDQSVISAMVKPVCHGDDDILLRRMEAWRLRKSIVSIIGRLDWDILWAFLKHGETWRDIAGWRYGHYVTDWRYVERRAHDALEAICEVLSSIHTPDERRAA